MSNDRSNLLGSKLDSPNWLENDDDLTLKPVVDDIGAQAYIPPDDEVPFNSGPSTVPATAGAPPQNGETPNINNDFQGSIFSLNYYRRYFNISTKDFQQNIFDSANFFSHVEKQDELGDLYGPIWVSATVIFILFFSNTSSNLLVKWIQGGDDKYEYNFNLLTGAISLLYGYTFIVPTVFFILSTFYFKLTAFFTLSKIISIYGYSNSAWIPAAILSIMRGLLVNHKVLSSVLKWASVLIGGVVSSASIFTKIYPVTNNSSLAQGNEKLGILLVGALGIAHFGFIVAVKVLFFGDLNVIN